MCYHSQNVYDKVVLVHAMKAYRGSRGIAPLILNPAGEWSISRPGRFTPGKEPLYPFNRRLRGPQSRSGSFWKRFLAPVGIRAPDRPAHGLVTILTELYRLPLLLTSKY
jgi:hypothetical protein